IFCPLYMDGIFQTVLFNRFRVACLECVLPRKANSGVVVTHVHDLLFAEKVSYRRINSLIHLPHVGDRRLTSAGRGLQTAKIYFSGPGFPVGTLVMWVNALVRGIDGR